MPELFDRATMEHIARNPETLTADLMNLAGVPDADLCDEIRHRTKALKAAAYLAHRTRIIAAGLALIDALGEADMRDLVMTAFERSWSSAVRALRSDRGVCWPDTLDPTMAVHLLRHAEKVLGIRLEREG